MIDSQRLCNRLKQIHATAEQRTCAVLIFARQGIDKALDYCDKLEVVKALGEYQPVGYTVDAVDLPY